MTFYLHRLVVEPSNLLAKAEHVGVITLAEGDPSQETPAVNGKRGEARGTHS